MSEYSRRDVSVIIDGSRRYHQANTTAGEVPDAREAGTTHIENYNVSKINIENNRGVIGGGCTARGESRQMPQMVVQLPNDASEDTLPKANLQYSRDEILGGRRRGKHSRPNPEPSEESQASVTIPCGSTTSRTEKISNRPHSRELEKDAIKLRELQALSSRRSAAKTRQGIPTIPAVCRDMVGHSASRPMADILLERCP